MVGTGDAGIHRVLRVAAITMVGGPVVAKFMRNQVGTTVEVAKFLIQAIRIGGANHAQVRNTDHAAIQLFSGEEVGNITLDELLVGVPPRPELREQTG